MLKNGSLRRGLVELAKYLIGLLAMQGLFFYIWKPLSGVSLAVIAIVGAIIIAARTVKGSRSHVNAI